MYITLLKILVTISISVVGYPNLQGPFQISSFGPFIPMAATEGKWILGKLVHIWKNPLTAGALLPYLSPTHQYL